MEDNYEQEEQAPKSMCFFEFVSSNNNKENSKTIYYEKTEIGQL